MKEHLAGGTLRGVMVTEVVRSLQSHQGHVETSAAELGITPRTLRLWKHKWPELQNVATIETVLKVTKPKPKRNKVKAPKKRAKALKRA